MLAGVAVSHVGRMREKEPLRSVTMVIFWIKGAGLVGQGVKNCRERSSQSI